MFKAPDKYRATFGPGHALNSTPAFGNNGVFVLPYKGRRLYCIASDGAGWEHVSVTVQTGNAAASGGTYQIPKWREMCHVKDTFWGDEDTVLQYHPPKSVYVNCHPSCLHLWRPITAYVPVPDPLLVGPPT